MVRATETSIQSEKIRNIELPIIDLNAERSEVAKAIVKACEEFGFFKLINHNVSNDVMSRMEEEGLEFFSKPLCVKQQAGPANPYGYGLKNIGPNGDKGEVEYILLHSNPSTILEKSTSISTDPIKFRSAVSSYIEAVRELACEILELMAEGLGVLPDTSSLSRLISDVESGSLFRLNHYPPLKDRSSSNNRVIGFGDHTDTPILTLLTSNGVDGLQILVEDGVWVPIPSQPHRSFSVFVGDTLKALTNGRFPSVRHRAMVNTDSVEARMSMIFFGAPPLTAKISPIPELVTQENHQLYRSFTWAEYQTFARGLRLGENRLRFFKLQEEDDQN